MKMKAIKWLAMPVIAAAFLTGCASQAANETPELRGISDKSCLVNTAVDLLDGVAALDKEDGDITPDLQITVTPEATVENGLAVFTRTGEYEVEYRISDSTGRSAKATSYITVVERDVYLADAFSNGFSVEAGGSAEVVAAGLTGDAYAFKAKGGEIAEDVRLTRTYSLTCGVEYTFKYYLTLNRAGVIKAAADGAAIAEREVSAGANTVQFTHALPSRQVGSDGEMPAEAVTVELWLGGLDGEIEATLSKVEAHRPQDNNFIERLDGFSFDGKAEAGFSQDIQGDLQVSEDGSSCSMRIAKTAENPARWHANLYINTGVAIKAGNDYEVSFDLLTGNETDICFNRTRGKEKSLGAQYGVRSGKVTFYFTADDFKVGTLWVQIQAGDNENTVTVSNLNVKSKETESREYRFYAFNQFHADGINGSVRTEYGKILYNAQSFGSADWNNNEISGPELELTGAAVNYVITFTAKASKPLRCAFIAHDEISDEWITFVWKEIKITETETQFSIRCDDKNLGGRYRFMWQFGNAENAAYTDVNVEISDFRICLKSDLEN